MDLDIAVYMTEAADGMRARVCDYFATLRASIKAKEITVNEARFYATQAGFTNKQVMELIP